LANFQGDGRPIIQQSDYLGVNLIDFFAKGIDRLITVQ
jgi:hypothetical protein